MNRYKTYNLKLDNPTVQQAIAMLELEIELCKKEGIFVLKVIHGYGSNGVGGAIKRQLHKWFIYAKNKGEILDFVKGENITDNNLVLKKMKEICPDLIGDFELLRTNAGLSLIWISK